MSPLNVLRAMLALYGGNPARWTTGTGARDANGDTIRVGHESAACFCLAGAAYRCDPVSGGYSALLALFPSSELNPMGSAIDWNDQSGRSFAEVQQLIATTIARLEAAP